MEHLSIPITDNALKKLLERHSFEKKKKVSNHYRKGKEDDWKNHLGLHHLNLLAELTDDVTETLGYD